MKIVRLAILALTPVMAAIGAVVVGAQTTPFLLAVLGLFVLASVSPRLAHAPVRTRRR